ncbi:hypothetical protein BATDEDRAFT_86161 [Batrachochytrium dendrobatidis JAM81]|uniref:TBC1 domain family member 7 n=1 Tax=Batrachochytrium dendrobatidis (strain JAM81 / FGSC 10211) TaxID=684364 RepID=F4NXJ3_BATDJ|nr:uncharacterized protein BATDEDRAFT_86161 [Batrachochytrium dendrobatidis JAM81]EGF82357.1 hypothetical protein BATDEDRAFT_86161 [Batrachochytrium dendrobatidis JAM81]KAJ8328338.1 TBC1 domain member 7 [Batrachochytrium dendrobatidis]KAK5673398.1 TBC1 domain member 7 [Batrachochytrium dendrobatidis]|eukprot:XP_006676893.1 hypothetical protein BATDEDRAFT_86161 [Batrachochytrium dendrobatidis JAM81]
MAANFRKAYYSSLGVKTLEVKPSVENALQGKLLSIDRLNKLCLWIRIPHFYRPVVWKLLLGVTPVHKEAWGFVAEQRQQHFEILKESVLLLTRQSLDRIDEDLTPLLLAQMIQLELIQDTPRTISQTITNEEPPEHLLAISAAFLEISDSSDQDAFWICLHFIKKMHIDISKSPKSGSQYLKTAFIGNNPVADLIAKSAAVYPGPEQPLLVSADQPFINDIRSSIDTMKYLLSLHNLQLFTYIQRLNVAWHDVCSCWFRCCFANVISSHAIESVWDIVIGGAPGILPYLGLCLLLSARRKIEACRSAKEFAALIPQISKFVDVDSVANMSIDMWEIPVLERMSKETRKLLGYRF